MAGGGPQIIAYVLGPTRTRSADYSAQRERLVKAGCIVTETAARSSLVARRIATDNPGCSGRHCE